MMALTYSDGHCEIIASTGFVVRTKAFAENVNVWEKFVLAQGLEHFRCRH